MIKAMCNLKYNKRGTYRELHVLLMYDDELRMPQGGQPFVPLIDYDSRANALQGRRITLVRMYVLTAADDWLRIDGYIATYMLQAPSGCSNFPAHAMNTVCWRLIFAALLLADRQTGAFLP
jgi:hypothetical protein